MKGPARFTALANPCSFLNLTSQSRWTFANASRSIPALMRALIKFTHDLDGEFVADRPKAHEQVLRSGFNKTAAKYHHAFARLWLRQSAVAAGR